MGKILRKLFNHIFFEYFRHRKSEDDEMTGGARCCFGFLVLIAQILLHGVLGLVWFWIVHYHSDEKATWGAFAWRDNPELEFNLHPVLMITGFIYFSGQCMYKLGHLKPPPNVLTHQTICLEF